MEQKHTQTSLCIQSLFRRHFCLCLISGFTIKNHFQI